MNRHISRVCGLGFLLLSIQVALGQDRFILRAPAASVPAIAARHGLTTGSPADSHNLSVVLSYDVRTPDQVIAEVSADPDVTSIELDRAIVSLDSDDSRLSQSTAAILDAVNHRAPMSFFGTPVWTSYAEQPAEDVTNIDSAQTLATGSGVLVAVIDTGVDPGQPVLRNVLVPGYDFVHDAAGVASELSDLGPATATSVTQAPLADKDTVVQLNQSTAAILDQSTAAILDTSQLPSFFGHGTMVAGIVHLVAPMAQIMPLKAFGDDGSASLVNVVRAIYFAVDNGARVINMSFNIPHPSLELMKAVNYATGHGVVCVASAGNGGEETLTYPAAFQNVIGVASTTNNDSRSSFSNFGAALVELAAPGENIVTLYPGGNYAVASGTSFAAPFVSGGAALMVQLSASLSQKDALQAFSKAKKLTFELGYGRVDLYSAAKSVKD